MSSLSHSLFLFLFLSLTSFSHSSIVFVIIIHFLSLSLANRHFFAVVFLPVRIFFSTRTVYTRTIIYNIHIRHRDTLYCFLFYFLSHATHNAHNSVRTHVTRAHACRLALIFIRSILLDYVIFRSRTPGYCIFQPYVFETVCTHNIQYVYTYRKNMYFVLVAFIVIVVVCRLSFSVFYPL